MNPEFTYHAGESRTGFAYVAVLVLLVIVFTLGMGFIVRVGAETNATMARSDAVQVHYLAESAANHAVWRLLNVPTFPDDETKYYMHSFAGGRYGYKVRRHSNTTFATVATVAALDQTVVRQSYVVYVLPPPTNAIKGAKLYWTDTGTNWIQRADTDGENLENLVTSGLVDPRGVAVDAISGKMYWADAGSDKIQRADLDGANVEDLVTSGLVNPVGIALDVQGGKMYWSDDGTDKIQRANFDGSNVEDLVTGLSEPGYVALAIVGTITPHVNIRVAQGSDDAEEAGNGNMSLNSTTLDLGSIGNQQWVATRFQDIAIPRGTLITRAYVEFRANANDSSTADVTIRGEDVDDAATFASSRDNLSTRSKTSAAVSWNGIPAWTTLSTNQTPDLTSIVQEIIDRSGWSSGNDLAILFESTSSNGDRDSYSYEGASSNAPLLHIEYNPADGQKIYWTDRSAGKIQRANLDGSNVEDILTGLSAPTGIDVDVETDKLYWTSDGTGRVRRANLDGSNLQDIAVSNVDSPRDITLSVAEGRTYWTDPPRESIRGSDLDGANARQAVASLDDPRGIAIEDSGILLPRMYWSDEGDDIIRRSEIDGSNIEEILTSGLNNPQAIDVDPAEGKIYWTEQGSHRIRRANLDGSEAEDLINSGLNGPEGLMLDLTAGKIYWNEQPGRTLRRSNLDGTNMETLRTDLNGWVVQLTLDLDNGKVYWTENGNRIRRCNLDGSNAELIINANYAYGIDLDRVGGKIYWAEANLSEIRRADLDGSNVTTVVSAGLDTPRAIFVDSTNSKLYWTDLGNDVIQRSGLDGANIETLVTGLNATRGLTLDAVSLLPSTTTASVLFEDYTESNASGNVNSLTISTPAGTSAGDLLIATVVTDGTDTLSPPAAEGWTTIDATGDPEVSLGVWWKLADASESASHTFTWTANQEAYGWIMRFTGHDPVTPIHASATNNGTSNSPTSPSVTTTIDDTMIVRIGGFDDDDVTLDNAAINGHTTVTMDRSGTGNGTASGGAGFVTQPTSGASGTADFGLNSSEEFRTVTIAIAPN